MFQKATKFIRCDMAIDLGTANTLVFLPNKGVAIREPSVVAVMQTSTGKPKVVAVGSEAKNMLGRTPGNIQAIRPVKDGVIANFDVTAEMMKYFIKRVQKETSFFKLKPRLVIGIPAGITQVEKRAVREAAEFAGSGEVYLIDESMAAAVGAGLPISEPNGNMIIDIGGGTTEIAVISMGGVVYSHSSKIGGDTMDENIIQYVKKKYNLLIGEKTAEQIKIDIGCAFNDVEAESNTKAVKGRDLLTGIPRIISLTNQEVMESLSDICELIIQATKNALEDTPPELAADIVDRGIVLSGGGSLLRNLDILLRERTRLPIIYAEDPLSCVALGVGYILNNLDQWKKYFK